MGGLAEDAALLFKAPFGVTLRAFRKRSRLRQLDLALAVFVDHTQLSRWESGARVPNIEEVARLAAALDLTESEARLLHGSWRRTASSDPQRPGAQLENLEISLESARRLRLLGQPRIAYELARRDARLAITSLQEEPGTDATLTAGLDLVSRILLEEAKAALDFATEGSVHNGLLQENRSLHRLVTSGSPSMAAKQIRLMGDEAAAYGSGNFALAHRLGSDLVANLQFASDEHRAEIIRAEAINCGVLNDGQAISQVWRRFLQTEDELTPEHRGFILEGFVRGFSALRPDRSFEILEVQKEFLAAQHGSPVRWIQLVRAEAELHVAVFGQLKDDDAVRRVERSLELARGNNLSKYEQLLEKILHQM